MGGISFGDTRDWLALANYRDVQKEKSRRDKLRLVMGKAYQMMKDPGTKLTSDQMQKFMSDEGFGPEEMGVVAGALGAWKRIQDMEIASDARDATKEYLKRQAKELTGYAKRQAERELHGLEKEKPAIMSPGEKAIDLPTGGEVASGGEITPDPNKNGHWDKDADGNIVFVTPGESGKIKGYKEPKLEQLDAKELDFKYRQLLQVENQIAEIQSGKNIMAGETELATLTQERDRLTKEIKGFEGRMPGRDGGGSRAAVGGYKEEAQALANAYHGITSGGGNPDIDPSFNQLRKSFGQKWGGNQDAEEAFLRVLRDKGYPVEIKSEKGGKPADIGSSADPKQVLDALLGGGAANPTQTGKTKTGREFEAVQDLSTPNIASPTEEALRLNPNVLASQQLGGVIKAIAKTVGPEKAQKAAQAYMQYQGKPGFDPRQLAVLIDVPVNTARWIWNQLVAMGGKGGLGGGL
jgi:hypothetical protein